MQKKLIVAALAGLAAAPAFAQSNVTVYGRVDMGYRVTDVDTTVRANNTTTNVKDTVAADASGLTTSRLGFRGTEDLGNGLKANFLVEYALADTNVNVAGTAPFGTTAAPDNASDGDTVPSLANRHFNVGLSGGFGALTLGRTWTAIEKVWGVGSVGDTNNIRGTLYTSAFGKGHGTRISNAITYATPSMSGLTAELQYGMGNKETAGDDVGADRLNLNAIYKAGALTAGVGYSKDTVEEVGAGKTETTAFNLGANYNLGPAQLFAMYADVKAKDKAAGTTTSDRDGFEIGVKVPMGKTNLIASYYDAENKQTNGTIQTDLSGFQLGALYSLSKRTTAYALYGSEDEKSSTATNSKVDRQQYTVGIRHDF